MENITAKDLLKAPNLMSIFRIVLIPVFLLLTKERGFSALVAN